MKSPEAGLREVNAAGEHMGDGDQMALYKLRFFNHGDHTVGTDHFRAENDEEAKRHARDMLKTPFGRGHEIWDGERLVHREVYER